jgi:surface protein
VNDWKEVLQELEPVAHKIKVFSGNQTEIYDNVKATMNLVDDSMTPDCGRLISTDKTFATSNKGANCLPFAKLNEVLFKLEIGTSSFKNAETFLLGEVGVVDSVISSLDTVLKNDTNVGKVMTAFEEFEQSVTDPQVYEAAFNVKVAKGLKRAVSDANEVTWIALRDELTSLDKNRIAYSIAEDAARHFMRITTTDESDKAVDSIDADALNPKTELPTYSGECPLEIDVRSPFDITWSKDSAEDYALAEFNALNATIHTEVTNTGTNATYVTQTWQNTGTSEQQSMAQTHISVTNRITSGGTVKEAAYGVFCSLSDVDCGTNNLAPDGVVVSYTDPENYEVINNKLSQTVKIVYRPTGHVFATGDFNGIESVTPVNNFGVTVELFDVLRCTVSTTARPLTTHNLKSAILSCLTVDSVNGNCTNEKYGSMSGWDTSRVTTMKETFKQKNTFNGDIGSWNTISVTDMNSMFYGASAFNQSISSWDTGQVTDMNSMFYGASVFNQDISSWDTGQVTDMENMFGQATAFNQNISLWTGTAATTAQPGMFAGVTAFVNQAFGCTNPTTGPASSCV